MPMSAIAHTLKRWVKKRSFEEDDSRTNFVLELNIEGSAIQSQNSKLLHILQLDRKEDLEVSALRELIGSELYDYSPVIKADTFSWKWYHTGNNDNGLFIRVRGKLVVPEDPYYDMIQKMAEVNDDI